jgi:hypothetical protein
VNSGGDCSKIVLISADLIPACRRYKNVAKAGSEFETRIGKADAGFLLPGQPPI